MNDKPSGNNRAATDEYSIRVLPAGKNDKVVEISDRDGHILKYIHSRYHLGNSAERLEIEQVKHDLETLGADEFSAMYNLSGSGK